MDSTFPVWKAKDRNMTTLFANIKRHALESMRGEKLVRLLLHPHYDIKATKKKLQNFLQIFVSNL